MLALWVSFLPSHADMCSFPWCCEEWAQWNQSSHSAGFAVFALRVKNSWLQVTSACRIEQPGLWPELSWPRSSPDPGALCLAHVPESWSPKASRKTPSLSRALPEEDTGTSSCRRGTIYTVRTFSTSAAGELSGKLSSADAAVLCCDIAAEARSSLLHKCRWVFVNSKQLNSMEEKAVCASPLFCALLLQSPRPSGALGMNALCWDHQAVLVKILINNSCKCDPGQSHFLPASA